MSLCCRKSFTDCCYFYDIFIQMCRNSNAKSGFTYLLLIGIPRVYNAFFKLYKAVIKFTLTIILTIMGFRVLPEDTLNSEWGGQEKGISNKFELFLWNLLKQFAIFLKKSLPCYCLCLHSCFTHIKTHKDTLSDPRQNKSNIQYVDVGTNIFF